MRERGIEAEHEDEDEDGMTIYYILCFVSRERGVGRCRWVVLAEFQQGRCGRTIEQSGHSFERNVIFKLRRS